MRRSYAVQFADEGLFVKLCKTAVNIPGPRVIALIFELKEVFLHKSTVPLLKTERPFLYLLSTERT